jgi:uncharacterized protein YjbI with pentapeptide repeats
MANSEHVKVLEKQWHLNPFKTQPDAWRLWRKEHPETLPDLSGAMLHSRDLRGQDFSRTDLREANLVGAVLSRTDCRDADFSGAYLNSATFFRADLRNVNFAGADLTQVNLTASALDGANFKGALLGGTVFGDTDLRGVRCLDSAVHLFPSTIGMDTLQLGHGELPSVFLRRCGLSDVEIEMARLQDGHLSALQLDHVLSRVADSYVSRPSKYYSCFISYSHADKLFARALFDRLLRHGIQCWLDEKQLLPGDDIYEQVDRGIKLWDKVLLCCSEHSLTSWWVDNEISAAFAKEQQIMKERGKKVLALIPLNLDGYLFKWTNGKTTQIQTRLASDFTSWHKDAQEFEAQIERVISALRVDSGGREAPPRPKL